MECTGGILRETKKIWGEGNVIDSLKPYYSFIPDSRFYLEMERLKKESNEFVHLIGLVPLILAYYTNLSKEDYSKLIIDKVETFLEKYKETILHSNCGL